MRFLVRTVVIALILVPCITADPGFADEVSVLPSWTQAKAGAPAPQPLRVGEKLVAPAAAALAPARDSDAARFEAMLEHNRSGLVPLQQGFNRSLQKPYRARIEPGSLPKKMPATIADNTIVDRRDNGNLVLMIRIDVAGAYGVRLHLTEVSLPKHTSMWVYATGEQASPPFGLGLLRASKDLWAPTVYGDEIWLEVEVPAADLGAGLGFTIAEIGEIFHPQMLAGPVLASDGKLLDDPNYDCLVDAPCVDLDTIGLGSYERAVAHLLFESGGSHYICTGTLLNDMDSTGTPYMLTANHCFGTQGTASTLEAYFDYQSNGCNGSQPSLSSLPRTNGATLLATNEVSDFTLVELGSTPSGARTFMGWDANPLPNGTTLHRLSHPAGKPLAYSRSTLATTTVYNCSDVARPNYLYTLHEEGSTWGGSSGSSLVKANGQVVGQLNGKCGPADGWDDCNNMISVIDGAFRTTYPYIQAWLNPGAGPGDCVSSINPNSTVTGSWSSDCASTNNPGAYARYYTFSLSSTSTVEIDLVSTTDSYLYLLQGSGMSGNIIDEDDDSGDGSNARISRTLNAGTYTIEATTYYSQRTGTFNLTLTSSGGNGGDYAYMVAGIAASGSWRSYLSVTNRSGRTANLTLIYRSSAGVATRTHQLANNGTKGWDNIVVNLFGAANTGGAVEVQSDQPVIVQARTFNDTVDGTFGQYLPGVTEDEMIGNGVSGLLGQLRNASGFYTNIGFVNPGNAACTVRIRIYSTSGAQLGSAVTTSVPAGGWKQVNKVFNSAGIGATDLAYAVVEVTSSGCLVWAYASVVDDNSKDPTTIPVILLN
jgi:hypothetical protein